MAPVARGASPAGRRADAALATAPTPADSAAPPAAARLPTLAVAAAPIAAPALEILSKFNKYVLLSNHAGVKKKKKVKDYLRESRSRLAKEDEEPPGDGGRNSKAGQAAQRRQGDLDRAGQPAGRGLRQPHARCVLNLKDKQNSFSKKFSHPPPINFLPKTGGRVYPVTSNLYQQFSVT